MKLTSVFLVCCVILIGIIMPLRGQEATADCPDAPPPRLIIGEYAQVTPGDPNNVRDEPSVDGNLLGAIPGEGIFEVWAGPTCSDGFNWWMVHYAGLIGWTVEGSGDDYWLQPYELPVTTTPPPTQIFDTTAVEYQNVQFEFDAGLATSINSQVVPATNLGLWDEPYPEYIEFSLIDYPDENRIFDPSILIYSTFGLEQNPRYFDDIENLRQFLITPPESFSGLELPLIVNFGIGAGQLLRTQVRYVDFANGSGIRFITMYAQDTLPIINSRIVYTFQGLTSDGQYYVSMTFPITSDVLDNDDSFPFTFNGMDEFTPRYNNYLANTEALLDTQPSDSFFPSLDLLDSLIMSLQIGDSFEDTDFSDTTSPTFTPTPRITLTPTLQG